MATARNFTCGHTATQAVPRSRQCVQRSRHSVISRLFTGIVQGTAEVSVVDQKDAFSSLKVTFPKGAADGIQLGASVAINGTCLTVTEINGGTLSFDIIVETLRATNLGLLRKGSHVNYERSARVGDEIGGHTVSGHVHTSARISEDASTEDNRRIVMTLAEPKFIKYILPKGFVAVDGCSLTVGEVGEDWFSVYLIPETLRVTVMGNKGLDDTVNVEIETQTQAIVDTVERVVQRYMETAKPPAV